MIRAASPSGRWLFDSDHSDLQWPCILSLLWLHTQGAALHPANSISSPRVNLCVCVCVWVHKEELIKQLLKGTSCLHKNYDRLTMTDCDNLWGVDKVVDQYHSCLSSSWDFWLFCVGSKTSSNEVPKTQISCSVVLLLGISTCFSSNGWCTSRTYGCLLEEFMICTAVFCIKVTQPRTLTSVIWGFAALQRHVSSACALDWQDSHSL